MRLKKEGGEVILNYKTRIKLRKFNIIISGLINMISYIFIGLVGGFILGVMIIIIKVY